MRIAIDARGVNWYRGTGIGTYTENIIRNILNMDSENYYQLYWAGKGYKKYNNNSKIILTSNKHINFFQEQYFPSNLIHNNIDIFHLPQNGIGFVQKLNCKKIVTIHDLIPYVMPETVGKSYLTKFLKEMPYIIESSDAIITVSDYSKRYFKIFPYKSPKNICNSLSFR